jgi:hypothetical protein
MTFPSSLPAWGGRILTVLVTLAFFGSGMAKIAHAPKMVEGLTHAGIPEAALLPIGILEVVLAVLYVLPRTLVLGTFLLTGFVGGAIITHVIARESFAAPLVLGLLMFAGSYLRNPDLRRIVPFVGAASTQAEFANRTMPVAS